MAICLIWTLVWWSKKLSDWSKEFVSSTSVIFSKDRIGQSATSYKIKDTTMQEHIYDIKNKQKL